MKEELAGGKILGIKGKGDAITKVSYFKGKDPFKWKSSISTYATVNFGEVYKGIGLRLKAQENNVEKIFVAKPGADPDAIRIKLNGTNTLRVNKQGQLEAETALGIVTFTKPIAYQEIKGKRVEVDCKYTIHDREPLSGKYPNNTDTDNGHVQKPLKENEEKEIKIEMKPKENDKKFLRTKRFSNEHLSK